MPGEKTEKATAKRKKDERKKGNVFMSREIVTVSTLLVAFFSFRLLMPITFNSATSIITSFFTMGADVTSLNAATVQDLFGIAFRTYAVAALPILVICALTSVVITMAQTRMMFSAKAFEFKFERIDPLKGFRKMFSMRSLVELVKSILKISVLLYIIYSVLKDEIMLMPRLMDMSVLAAASKAGSIILEIVLLSSIIFAFLGAADYVYQWYEYEKNLRMSKQEVKDEYKQVEGDPQIKARIRAMQQQRARRRMMQNVATADVIIRNPTHYAVALKYNRGKNIAPVVVAKGVDSLALRIIAEGEKHSVYITEDRPLARALYEAVPLDREIPGEFYQAIAEILAHVYKLEYI